MRLLFTGAESYLAKQTDSGLSLGGLISSSIVPNNRMNNLFSDISYISQQYLKTEVRAIILENKELYTAEDVIVGYEYDSENFDIDIAFIALASDDQQMETVTSGEDIPYEAVFQEARKTTSSDGSVNVGDLAVDGRMGIWLRRKIKQPTLETEFATVDDEINFWKNLAAQENEKTINLIIKYSINVPD